jgi:hypothetical protein
MVIYRSGRVTALIGIAAAALLLSACAPNPHEESPHAAAAGAAATQKAESIAPEPPTTAAPARRGAADAFRAWLDASRIPDAASSCAALSPELATRMIAELNDRGPIHVSSCEEMIAVTAELYRALDQDASVDISVQQETATDATLFVTYLATGNCGTVVMTRPASDWIITEQSQECAA